MSFFEQVRNDCWKGVFHNGLPQIYEVVASLAYIGYSQASKPPGASSSVGELGLVVGVAVLYIVVPIPWYTSRILQGLRVQRQMNTLENAMQEQQDFMLGDWRTIRRAGADHREVSVTFEAYWALIRKGMYVDWYYRFYLREKYTLFMALVTTILYLFTADQEVTIRAKRPSTALSGLLPPALTFSHLRSPSPSQVGFDAATFVPLLAVLRTLGGGMQQVCEAAVWIVTRLQPPSPRPYHRPPTALTTSHSQTCDPTHPRFSSPSSTCSSPPSISSTSPIYSTSPPTRPMPPAPRHQWSPTTTSPSTRSDRTPSHYPALPLLR